jgi:hypothetical protein
MNGLMKLHSLLSFSNLVFLLDLFIGLFCLSGFSNTFIHRLCVQSRSFCWLNLYSLTNKLLLELSQSSLLSNVEYIHYDAFKVFAERVL